MYYVEEMTQSDIADVLGIGRVTVVRLLADARALNEVRISVSRDLAELPRLEMGLQKRFGLKEAIVAPFSRQKSDPTRAIGAAAGQFISDNLRPGMRIGLGWGRTLFESLVFLEERQVADVSVISLLGGITKAQQYNPSEYAWQFSRLFQAQCYLLAAPALVDTPATRDTLIEHCGLGEIFELAKSMDTVVLSVGSIVSDGTAYKFGYLTEKDRLELLSKGAVGDLLYHYMDRSGKLLDHPINDRIMSVPLDTIKATPSRILVSGGADKVEAIEAVMQLVKPTVFITDELTAAHLVDGVPVAA